jgi:hypothetical protein
MELIKPFKTIILKIDLSKVKAVPKREYESLRQELGININTSLSGSRAGEWIGGRIKKNNILLFFRVSDSPKAKAFILRLISNYHLLSNATVRIKEKKMKWGKRVVI